MKIKTLTLAFAFVVIGVLSVNAQFGKLKIDKKKIDAVSKGVKAFTLTDAEISGYCKEYIDWMDKNNPVCTVTDKDAGMRKVATRLDNIVKKIPANILKDNGINIKAYYVVNINAFACGDGSIRIFAGLMEKMTDDEILAVIGHEIGHIVNRDVKDAYKTALLTSALKDAVASTHDAAASLTDSQLGSLGEAIANSQFSQKQENAADEYGFNFMKTCKSDVNAMASSLKVLLKLQEEAGATNGGKMDQLLSSHPGLDKRIARLEKMK